MLKFRQSVLGRPNAFNVNQIDQSNGKKGNLETVDIMQRMARSRAGHPEIREMALDILDGYNTDSHDYINEAKAIGHFVQQKVKYVRDVNGIEQLHDPLLMVQMIRNGATVRGDCDDMALLVATLLLAIGHNPKVRMVRYRTRKGPFDHIYVVVHEKNHNSKKRYRLVIDPIVKNKPIGFEVKHMSGEERNI